MVTVWLGTWRTKKYLVKTFFAGSMQVFPALEEMVVEKMTVNPQESSCKLPDYAIRVARLHA